MEDILYDKKIETIAEFCLYGDNCEADNVSSRCDGVGNGEIPGVTVDGFEVGNELVTYCATCENYKTSENHVYHMHIYLKFRKRTYVNDLRNFILDHFLIEREMDVQPAKSTKSILRYITKHDCRPYFNCSSSAFAISYKITEYLNEVGDKGFDATHPFVKGHYFMHKYLERAVETRQRQLLLEKYKHVVLKPVKRVQDCNWAMTVVKWWNDFVSKPYEHKKKQLFIYGPPNMGTYSSLKNFRFFY